jgi:hypothetical protein
MKVIVSKNEWNITREIGTVRTLKWKIIILMYSSRESTRIRASMMDNQIKLYLTSFLMIIMFVSNALNKGPRSIKLAIY